MTPALILALMLSTAAPPPGDGGEPLPPGAPSDSYALSAWCFGALNEYLQIYEKVKPDLRDIDRMFGTSVVEDEPYQSDMAAARVELKMIGDSVTAAEKASPRPIAERGVAAMHQGQGIWSLVEAKTSRELARAWLSWALPDRCDSNARELTTRSIVLGRALGFNAHDRQPLPAPAPEPAAPATEPPSEASQPILGSSAEFAPTFAAPAPQIAHGVAPTPVAAVPTPQPAASAPAAVSPAAQVMAAPPPTPVAAAAEPAGAVSPQVLDTSPAQVTAAPRSAAPPRPASLAAAPSPAPPTISPPNADEPQEPTL